MLNYYTTSTRSTHLYTCVPVAAVGSAVPSVAAEPAAWPGSVAAPDAGPGTEAAAGGSSGDSLKKRTN